MLSRLSLTNFTVFADADFQFGPGLNVLVGTNGTGKSHVLKVGYAVLSRLEERLSFYLFLVEKPAATAPAPTGHKLRRATQATGRTDLAQKLSAIPASWGLQFKLLGSPAPLQPASVGADGWIVGIDAA